MLIVFERADPRSPNSKGVVAFEPRARSHCEHRPIIASPALPPQAVASAQGKRVADMAGGGFRAPALTLDSGFTLLGACREPPPKGATLLRVHSPFSSWGRGVDPLTFRILPESPKRASSWTAERRTGA